MDPVCTLIEKLVKTGCSPCSIRFFYSWLLGKKKILVETKKLVISLVIYYTLMLSHTKRLQKVSVWAGILNRRMLEVYGFEENLTAPYLDFLRFVLLIS